MFLSIINRSIIPCGNDAGTIQEQVPGDLAGLFVVFCSGQALLVWQYGGTIRDCRQNDDGLCFHDARMILDAGQELFQRAGIFGQDFQGIVKISGDIVAFFDFRLVFDKFGEMIAMSGVVKAQEHECHEMLVQKRRVKNGRILLDDA